MAISPDFAIGGDLRSNPRFLGVPYVQPFLRVLSRLFSFDNFAIFASPNRAFGDFSRPYFSSQLYRHASGAAEQLRDSRRGQRLRDFCIHHFLS